MPMRPPALACRASADHAPKEGLVDNTAAMDVVADLILELKIPGVIEENIHESSTLRTDLGINSLNMLILLARIQEKTGIEFATLSRPIAGLKTVKDLLTVIDEHQQTERPAL
jgi:acyl carrier protein